MSLDELFQDVATVVRELERDDVDRRNFTRENTRRSCKYKVELETKNNNEDSAIVMDENVSEAVHDHVVINMPMELNNENTTDQSNRAASPVIRRIIVRPWSPD